MALRDGSTVHVRPVGADDEAAVLQFFETLDDASRFLRFFSGAADLRAAARLTVDVDYADRYGLVASRGQGDHLVGVGTYILTSPGRAEVAFAISGELQGGGLGTILLAHLAEVAGENGISEFVAEILPENHRMVDVFRESGFPVEMSAIPGAISVELPTSFSSDAVERFEERGRLAAAAGDASLPRAEGGGADRRLAPARHRRRRALPQPALVRLRGRRVSREPGRRRGPVRARLLVGR